MSLLAGARLVTPAGIVDGWLETSGQTIAAIGAGEPARPADRDLAGQWVVPGFVDMHVHGGGGVEFRSGDQVQAGQAVDLHRRHGTTTTVASLVTGDLAGLVTSLASLSELVDEGMLAGIHLEGPFLAGSRRGAHDPALLREPAPQVVEQLVSAGRGTVRMVTLAVELPHALDAVRRLAGDGIVVAVGHTDATYEQTRTAIEVGVTVGTHLFNAMGPLHHREPGPVPALLEDGRVTVELICDGVHVHPAVARMAVRSAGPGRVALITDAMAAAGAGDGDYRLGGQSVRVYGGVARLADGTIAGSTLTMDRAFRFAVEGGASIEDAARMSSSTPARALRLDDRVGSITVGRDADLVVLDQNLWVRAVMTKGGWLPGRA